MKNTISMIRQTDLQHVLNLEAQIEKAKKTIADLAAAHEDAVAPIEAMLLAKATAVVIEPGPLTCRIDWDVNRNVSWRNVVLTRLGESVVEKVLRDTQPTRRKQSRFRR